MPILDDLEALGIEPRDQFAVTTALETLSLSPAGRAQLIAEWQEATGLELSRDLRARLLSNP